MDAVGVGGKGSHWRRALVSVVRQVLMRERALPGIGHMIASGRKLVPPGVLGAVEAAPCRKLPFGFGGQFLARPLGVSLRVAIGDVDDRMVVHTADRTARSVR